MPDWYEILQVSPNAEPEVIRAAYRVLARKHHPDHGGSRQRMIDVNNAFEVLSDPVRRAEYDADRRAARAGSAPVSSAGPLYGSQSAASTPLSASTYSGRPGGSAVPHAGPPPGRPSGTVLDFGRYSGWSLGEIARHDRDYLEWLLRATVARKLRPEVEALLRTGRR